MILHGPELMHHGGHLQLTSEQGTIGVPQTVTLLSYLALQDLQYFKARNALAIHQKD